MPTYVCPKLAVIEESGSGLGVLAFILGALAIAAAVIGFITAHLVLLAVMAAILTAGTLGPVLALRRYIVPRQARREVRAPQVSLAVPMAGQAIPAERLHAIGTLAQHVHFHFHGVSAEDIATIMRQQEVPARLAIGENPKPSPLS